MKARTLSAAASFTACLKRFFAGSSVSLTLIVSSLMLFSGYTHAAYPEKAITIIVPYPTGGATDTLARLIGQKISESLKQPVVVENRSGGSGTIGMTVAMKAPADGYTILFAAVSDAGINSAAMSSSPVNLMNDFSPVAGVATAPHILVVPSSLRAQNLTQLIDYLKAAPGKYNFASIGVATLSHLESELLMMTTGVDIVHVPYRGGAQALLDLLAGNSTLMFLSGPAAMPHVKSGKLRVVAVASDQRLALFPEVPTITESGIKGYDVNNLFGFVMPKGSPSTAITTISKAIEAALRSPELQTRLEAQGLVVRYSNPDEFKKIIRDDFESFDRIVKKAKIRLD
jgi:tripartite-type tricarboxylate transporter receptor subunit TctC